MQIRWNRGGPLLGVIVVLCLLGPAVVRAESISPGQVPADPPPVGAAPTSELSVAAILAALAAEDNASLAHSFWQPLTELPAPLAARVPEYCGGAYVLPEFPYPLDRDPDSFPIRAEAGSVSYQVDGTVDLGRGVRLQQGNRTVTAARAVLDQTTRLGSVSGGVWLLEPGMVMQGDRADVNLDTRAAILEDVEFVLLQSALRGDASSVAQSPSGDLVIAGGSFTRCEPGNDNWRISASSLVVHNDDVFGTARNAVMRVRGVPVFYAPYIRFPVTDDRQSGWLFPNLSYRERDGFDVSLPYYFNLAPNYDATLSPRNVSERGPGIDGSFRYLSAWQESSFRGGLLYRDDLYDGELSRSDFEQLREAGQITGEFEPANRWLYGMRHAGRLGSFTTRIDYTAVSDRDYFRDLGNELGLSSLIALERTGEISYAAGGLAVRLWGQRFQRLDEGRIDPYQRLPQLEAAYQGHLAGPLQWSLATALVNFDRDNTGLTGVNAIVGQRVHVEPRVRLPLVAPWGFLTATGGYRYTQYDLSDQPAELGARPDRGLGFGSLHGGLFFERDFTAIGTRLVQTLEPQLFYLYQQFEPQAGLPRFDATELTFGYGQLFRDNRFSGLDRIGDANQLSVGLTSRIVDSGTGREYLRGSLGQIVYFRDRRVSLEEVVGPQEQQSTSALAGELAGSLMANWQLSSTIIWNPHENEVDEGAAALQYRRDNRHIVNFGYRWRLRDDIEQTDFSVYWPISQHYSVIGRWNYDLGSGRTVEAFGGIEYNDCCWQLRLMGRRFLDSPAGRDLDAVDADDGIFLQIVFKGLAGFGTKVESVLERGIRGYRTETFDAF